MKVQETIFNNRINTTVLRHKSSGSDTVWSGVNHMVIDLISLDGGANVQISSAIEPTLVDFSTNGYLTFILGDKGVTVGKYQVQLAAVDASSNKTQLIHFDKDYVIFSFSATKTVN